MNSTADSPLMSHTVSSVIEKDISQTVKADLSAGEKEKQLEADRESIKALLAEARNTKLVLEDFDSAVKNGNFAGHSMIAIAKGLSFLGAVIAQNKAHIENLQARLK